jgi:hypothetical protein
MKRCLSSINIYELAKAVPKKVTNREWAEVKENPGLSDNVRKKHFKNI